MEHPTIDPATIGRISHAGGHQADAEKQACKQCTNNGHISLQSSAVA